MTLFETIFLGALQGLTEFLPVSSSGHLVQGKVELISGLALVGAFLSSFLVGMGALKWLLGLLESGKFYWFSIYCFSVGGITLWLI